MISHLNLNTSVQVLSESRFSYIQYSYTRMRAFQFTDRMNQMRANQSVRVVFIYSYGSFQLLVNVDTGTRVESTSVPGRFEIC